MGPFYHLRAACEARHRCGIYTFPLPQHLHAFACCLPDDEVPTTTTYEERLAKEREELDLLGDLDAFEAAIPPMVSKKLETHHD